MTLMNKDGKYAVGLVETIGVPAAFVAADSAVKSANVTLLGYERSDGANWITVKFFGEVAAVRMAVDSAVSAAQKITGVISSDVIPRPGEKIIPMIESQRTVGVLSQQKLREEKEKKAEEPIRAEMKEQPAEIKGSYTCNICKDPGCPRKPGERKIFCKSYR